MRQLPNTGIYENFNTFQWGIYKKVDRQKQYLKSLTCIYQNCNVVVFCLSLYGMIDFHSVHENDIPVYREVHETSRITPLISHQGAALGTMTGFLTYGNKKFVHLDDSMRKLLPPLYATMKELLPYVDHDAAAFNDYMVC